MYKINLSYQMRCNAHWLLRLTGCALRGALLFGLLSGCHPCSWPGVNCLDGSFQTINAYTDNQKMLYFDIPIRTQYRHVDLNEVQIGSVKDGVVSSSFVWAIAKREQKNSSVRPNTGIEPSLPIPLYYGQAVPMAQIHVPPQPLENGQYAIWGSAYLYDEQRRYFVMLSGKFSYENGTARNLTRWDD